MAEGAARGDRRRTLPIQQNRFRSGRLGPPADRDTGGVLEREAAITVDVIRPSDLVSFTVEAFGCELRVGGSAPPGLRPRKNEKARLVVRLPYQHLAESAIYEASSGGSKALEYDECDPRKKPASKKQDYDPKSARPVPPIDGVRPARGSRLVFDIPAKTEVEFSVAGLLDAMGSLPLRVNNLAEPGLALPAASSTGLTLHLPEGAAMSITAAGVIVRKTTKAADRRDLGTADGIISVVRDLHALRAALATRAGAAATSFAPSEKAARQTIDIDGREVAVRPIFGAGGLITGPDPKIKLPAATRLSDGPPDRDETAIEAPFRLIISPDAGAGWAHDNVPVAADGASHRIELWHTRLGRRPTDSSGHPMPGPIDDKPNDRRIIRALWARDRERWPGWRNLKVAEHDDEPFRTSLDGADRHMLVRQSAETWRGSSRSKSVPPTPVAARALWLSSLGAFLDLHGEWQTGPYSEAEMASILSWDHLAPMGRDQYVKVVYPGYLFPFGHRAALVKITERKMKDATNSVAGLYQRKFLVVGEPVKFFTQRDLPFEEVRLAPLVTPNLSPDPGNKQNSYFWPEVDGQLFRFVLHCVDHEHRKVKLIAPLLWVAEHYGGKASERNAVEQKYVSHPDKAHEVKAAGQRVAFAPVTKGGDTSAEVGVFRFAGAAGHPGSPSTPTMTDADVALAAVQQLSPVADPVNLQYAGIYLVNDFGGAANSGDVWAEVKNNVSLSFGGGGGSSSEGAGGFVQPNIPIRGLSRISGTVGDVAGMATQSFDPATFLSGALPKLFGVVPLDKLVQKGGLLEAPSVVSESISRLEGLLTDLFRAKQVVADAVREAEKLTGSVKAEAIKLRDDVEAAANGFEAALGSLSEADEATVTTALTGLVAQITAALDGMQKLAPKLSPLVREELLKLDKVLGDVVRAADVFKELHRALNGLAAMGGEARFRFDWRPRIEDVEALGGKLLTVKNKDNGFVLSVDGRASGKGPMSVEVLAELRDFTLHLFPAEPLARAHFSLISFHAGSSGKPDVDVIFDDLEFVGILGFIETIKDLIPLDGFSDPPYLEVDAAGLQAGFTLGLPSIAIGVFALSNISLGADVQVPFLGKAVTVGFDFCSRERPFTLQVTFIGGGGWFGLRLSPNGLDVLELGLEAGATLAIDLGVASGSISAMIGVYMRLEGEKGSLAGYFRLRGEVDVMGMVSASIELYLELRYEMQTGKMEGSATITVEVEVLVFSGTVKISCRRQFAGSNGDPTFRQLMVESDGTAPAWSEYCSAFAEV